VSQKLGESPRIRLVAHVQPAQGAAQHILQDGCDAYFALPANADYRVRGLLKTRPFLDVSYAIVAPSVLPVSGLADLRGKRIGVLHGSPPHILLAAQQGYATSSFRANDEALAALERGEVEVAILWGRTPATRTRAGTAAAGR
jgi:ABC-type amino acid transport substrate-binding protein